VLTTSLKTRRFTESVIREMTRLCELHDAINLAQGLPDVATPETVKEAACRAIRSGRNQCSLTWGSSEFRAAIAGKYRRVHGWEIDPSREVTVMCGSTEAMIASLLAILDPGDEILLIEPFYENYVPDTILSGAQPRYIRLGEPGWTLDVEELAGAVNERTRGVVLNNPSDPTGKVYRRDELEAIADLCRKWDLVAFSDEVYEHITFDGVEHVPIATLPGMADRTVTIGALSQTYAVTGWRVGWAIAAPELTAGIRKVHDFLTVGAPAPFQEAGVAALQLDPGYYRQLAAEYARRRDILVDGLESVGFRCTRPSGGIYVLADASPLGVADDAAFARRLVEEVGVGCVPGSSFWSNSDFGRSFVRFTFGKNEETLREALRRLAEGLAN
jgi:aminotransferase